MNKVFLSIAFLLIVKIGMAQEANFKADVLKLIAISGTDSQIKVAKPRMLSLVPEENKEKFSQEFDASIPNLQDKMVKMYMEVYTHEDIKGIIAFYESPVGRKMSAKSAELLQKSMQAGQDWAQELLGIVKKYKTPGAVQIPTNDNDNTVYNTAGIDVKPDFPGGMDEFYKFIAANFITPKVEGLKGKVYVTFIIEKDGSLTDIKVLRDIGNGTGKEAIRVLELSPKWSSGQQNGKAVRCTYSLPISVMAK